VGGGSLEQQVIYHVYYTQAGTNYYNTTCNTSLSFNASVVNNTMNMEYISVNVTAENRFDFGQPSNLITVKIGKEFL